MSFLNSLENKSKKFEDPFLHWELDKPLTDEQITLQKKNKGIKKFNIEAIPTAYILLKSESSTSVVNVSKTTPLNIDNMKMRQPIYTNDVIYLLMGIDGVRSVNYVELTQDNLSNAVGGNSLFSTPLWDYNIDNPHTAHGASSNNAVNSGAYGYEYNFNQFYNGTLASDGIILPSVEPATFELKNPNQNIKGSVI